MEQRKGRDNILIGLMVILTYFLIYTFFYDSDILKTLGGLPMIDYTADLIQNGFSLRTMYNLVKDFGQTIIIIFIVIFVENMIPAAKSTDLATIIKIMIGYIVLYLVSMWIVRYIIFSSKMNEIIKMFIAIFSVILGCVGVIAIQPLRLFITKEKVNSNLESYLVKSRVMQWLANAFFVTSVLLFILVAIEMTVGLSYFFTVVLNGFPVIIAIAAVFVCFSCIIKV